VNTNHKIHPGKCRKTPTKQPTAWGARVRQFKSARPDQFQNRFFQLCGSSATLSASFCGACANSSAISSALFSSSSVVSSAASNTLSLSSTICYSLRAGLDSEPPERPLRTQRRQAAIGKERSKYVSSQFTLDEAALDSTSHSTAVPINHLPSVRSCLAAQRAQESEADDPWRSLVHPKRNHEEIRHREQAENFVDGTPTPETYAFAKSVPPTRRNRR
jgi:hypothetical protein